jgi:hypothetical protein
MTLTAKIREQVRRRANFACEFCGVTETSVGGELTVDHFQPITRGGDDSLENLVYCCHRCNQYKLNYWASNPDDPSLWNPRSETAARHFFELDDGTMHSITATGAFTIKRLRLNRPPLVAYRACGNIEDQAIEAGWGCRHPRNSRAHVSDGGTT